MAAHVALVVSYTDGSADTMLVGDGPGLFETWKVTVRSGVPLLVVGVGVPRVEIVLANVRGWTIHPLTQPMPECGAKHPEIDVHCHLPHEHDGPEHCTSESMDTDGIVWPT